MGKLAGDEDEHLPTGAVVVEGAGTLADGAEAVVSKDDDGVTFAEGYVTDCGFVLTDEGRDQGESATGPKDAVKKSKVLVPVDSVLKIQISKEIGRKMLFRG